MAVIGKRLKPYRKGTVADCDKGRCEVVGRVSYGYVMRAADGTEWLRKRAELLNPTFGGKRVEAAE
jgi:hypothetical protein